MGLLSSNLKNCLRGLWRDRTYTILNLLGLVCGMTAAMLIFIYIRDELSFDRYHTKARRIFRVVDGLQRSDGPWQEMALTSAACAPRLKSDFPEVEAAARLFPRRRMVEIGINKFYEDDLFYADSAVFRIFSLPLIRGHPASAMVAPDKVVLDRSTAEKYFGNEDPIGREVQIEGEQFQVSAVMEDMPQNSHFHMSILVSLRSLEKIPGFKERYLESWARHEFYTYILLREGADPVSLQAKLPAFIERYAAEEIRSVLGARMSSRLQPLTQIWLHSGIQHELRPTSDMRTVSIFGLIGFFILFVACSNYMNLATARSVSRNREVGLRKVLGAHRGQLIVQFLGESFILNLIALVLTVLTAAAALPAFNRLMGKNIDGRLLLEPGFFGASMALLFLMVISAGGYPALYIARFHPADVLRGKDRVGSAGRSLRRILVSTQFAVTMALIVATGVVLDQLDYLRNRKLGFKKQHVMLIPVRSARIRRDYETVKSEMAAIPGVIGSTITIGVPGGIAAGDSIRLLTEDGPVTITLNMIYTDHDYVDVLGLQVVEGRNFSRDITTDVSQAFIINQSAVRALGLEDPLSARFEWGTPKDRFHKRGKVIGVVKDFSFRTLKAEIQPFVIHIHPMNAFTFAVRIRPDLIQKTAKAIEGIWAKWDSGHPFEYSFLDENYDRLYRGEERMARGLRVLTFLAMGIAALGLFGLAMFTVQRRTREIGIRKVLGASGRGICWLIIKDFTDLIGIAGLVAWPTVYWSMRSWLNHFAYRTHIGIGIFLLSAGVVLATALLTVSWQTLRAAAADPVESLRFE